MESETSTPEADWQPADIPAPRVVEQPWMSLADWRSRHERQLAQPGRADAELVFLGDSITEAWVETRNLRDCLARHQPLNLGVGGDQTQHVLWRIEQGTLQGLSPRLVVLLIGVNNLLNGYTPEETVRGITSVVQSVRRNLPEARVLLLNVLPAGEHRTDELRRAVVRTNQLLGALSEPAHLEMLDIGAVLLKDDGSIGTETMEDFLHPTQGAYRSMTDALAPTIERLLDARTQR